MVSYWIGWVHVVELRLLNFPIMCAGVYFALDQYKKVYGTLSYWRAITLGTYTSSIAALSFSLFLFVVFSLDHSFYQSVVKNEPFGIHLNKFIATYCVALEGIFSGLMATYIIINLIDTDKID
jgi:putative effector of murein hydrolase